MYNISFFAFTATPKNKTLQLFGENVIDEVGVQVKSLIDTAYVSAQKILLAHMDILKIVAETLLEKEIISGEEFDRIIEEQK